MTPVTAGKVEYGV
jgi:hypothetical protein